MEGIIGFLPSGLSPLARGTYTIPLAAGDPGDGAVVCDLVNIPHGDIYDLTTVLPEGVEAYRFNA